MTVQSDVIKVLIEQDKYASVTHFLKKIIHFRKRNSRLTIEKENVAKWKFPASSSNSSKMSVQFLSFSIYNSANNALLYSAFLLFKRRTDDYNKVDLISKMSIQGMVSS